MLSVAFSSEDLVFKVVLYSEDHKETNVTPNEYEEEDYDSGEADSYGDTPSL